MNKPQFSLRRLVSTWTSVRNNRETSQSTYYCRGTGPHFEWHTAHLVGDEANSRLPNRPWRVSRTRHWSFNTVFEMTSRIRRIYTTLRLRNGYDKMYGRSTNRPDVYDNEWNVGHGRRCICYFFSFKCIAKRVLNAFRVGTNSNLNVLSAIFRDFVEFTHLYNCFSYSRHLTDVSIQL